MPTYGNNDGWCGLAVHYFVKVIVESTENRLLINKFSPPPSPAPLSANAIAKF